MIQHDAVCDVCRQQLHQRLLNVKSPAETPEIVEKLKTLATRPLTVRNKRLCELHIVIVITIQITVR